MITTTTLTCACGKLFKKPLSEIRRQRKKNPQRVFYCSSVCFGNFQAKEYIKGKCPGVAHLHPGNRQDEYSPFRYYMLRARSRRHETNIDLPYLKDLWEKQGGCCALSGMPMEVPRNTREFEKRGHDPWKPSLDRIDCSKGYLKGNVRFVTMIANLAKQGWADTTVIEFCRAVVAHQE